MVVKKRLGKINFYSSIISELELTTNLTEIRKKLNISKQQLNYYLRELKKRNLIIKKGDGWYEVNKKSKNSTKYGSVLSKDSIRGHAYVWNVELPKKIEGWEKRIKILESKGVNFKLVGALKTTPRIKIQGRNVWLCNNHLRIFDKPKQSYYGKTAKESKEVAHHQLISIIRTLENKLGFLFKPLKYSINKEHYALIKNDLAIHHNKKGIILRVSDEEGEWLLIDDSLEEGGELENVGKKAFVTNKPMQNWWNQHKEDGFKTTPRKINKKFEKIRANISELTDLTLESSEKQINTSMLIKQMDSNIRGLTETVYQLVEVIKRDKQGI